MSITQALDVEVSDCMAEKKATTQKAATTKKTAKRESTRKSKAAPKTRKPSSKKKQSVRACARETHGYDGWGTFTVQQKRVILAYEHLPIPTKICEECGVSRAAFYKWQREKPFFKAAIERAEQISISNAEAVAMEIGITGRNELQIANGQVVMSAFDEDGNPYGTDAAGNPILKPLVRRVRDVSMLKKILEAKMPDQYGSKRVQLTGKNGGPVQSRNVNTVELGEEEIAKLPPEVLERIASKALQGNE